MPLGPPGVSREAKSSTELEFGALKIGSKTKKLQKSVKKRSFFDVFLVISEVFWTLLILGPILVHQTTKFEISTVKILLF